MRTMRSLLLLTLLLPAPALGQADTDPLPPEARFDFWVGRWEVSWDEADGAKGRGTNTIEKTLDGAVIREEFRVTQGSNEGFKGTSISVYQPRLKRWKQAWADNQGGYYDFTGRTEGDTRIFQTDAVELDDGRRLVQRMVFRNITDDSLTWDWEASYDGGETWSLNWRIFYERADHRP